MSRVHWPAVSAGNYLVLDATRLQEVARRYSVALFACLFLVVAGSGVYVGAAYWSAHITIAQATQTVGLRIPGTPLQGPNMVVDSRQLTASLQKITSQPLSLTIADKTVPIDADTIMNWVKVVSDAKQGVSYLHVDQTAIASTLKQAVAPFAKAPRDQVTATYADGTSAIIVSGKNGTSVGGTDQLAGQISAGLLGAKGLQLNVPTDSVPFAAVTPSAFDKLLEVNIVTKQMWAYEKGQLVRQFPISAGAPETPTPLGEYKIFEKLAVQDMRGFNANGTKYLQPHVRWISYFLPGGYAVHGNYWRPLSWFGAINSSHGCVSLPDDQAEWVYDWAPIGTTVITHA